MAHLNACDQNVVNPEKDGAHESNPSNCEKSVSFVAAASSAEYSAFGASFGFDSSRSRDVNGGNFKPPLVDGDGENGGT